MSKNRTGIDGLNRQTAQVSRYNVLSPLASSMDMQRPIRITLAVTWILFCLQFAVAGSQHASAQTPTPVERQKQNAGNTRSAKDESSAGVATEEQTKSTDNGGKQSPTSDTSGTEQNDNLTAAGNSSELSRNEADKSEATSTKEVESKPETGVRKLEDEGLPLIVGGEEILRFKTTISGFTPAQRVAAIQERIASLIKKADFDPRAIKLVDTGYSTDLVCGKSIILTVTDVDARLIGFNGRKTLAADCTEKLSRALAAEKLAHSPKVILFAVVQTIVATLVLLIILLLLAAIFPRVYAQIEILRGKYVRAIKIQNSELVSEESLADLAVGSFRVVRGLMTITLILIYLERVLSFFPTTSRFSTRIVDDMVLPVMSVVGLAISSYFPNLLIIALITASTYYLITFTHFIFKEIGRGQITISEFDPEWADPTYKIARFLIVAFALVLIFPYLPGSGSPAFQQISIFLGVLISLGSSGAVSNIVAGVFLTYTGAFRLGDRVKISDTVGDVVERRLLYTRVRTIKDEYITIPNSMVLGAHIINYSSSTRRSGLILHTSVTIGYDTAWQKIEELLLAAAKETRGVLGEPTPFVLITELNDFYVTHEINCYTSSPHMMAVIYADLHKSILNKFAEAGVEIMSPHYNAIRNGNRKALPEPIVAAAGFAGASTSAAMAENPADSNSAPSEVAPEVDR